MVARLLAIRQALQQRISNIPDFPVFHYVADSAPPPCAWIEPDEINYRVTMTSSDATWRFIVTVVTGRANEAAAQDELDKYLSPDGAHSIPNIIEQDTTLGGAVDYAVCTEMVRYGTFVLSDISYIGAQIIIEARL